jgi:hypothetical protein
MFNVINFIDDQYRLTRIYFRRFCLKYKNYCNYPGKGSTVNANSYSKNSFNLNKKTLYTNSSNVLSLTKFNSPALGLSKVSVRNMSSSSSSTGSPSSVIEATSAVVEFATNTALREMPMDLPML